MKIAVCNLYLQLLFRYVTALQDPLRHGVARSATSRRCKIRYVAVTYLNNKVFIFLSWSSYP